MMGVFDFICNRCGWRIDKDRLTEIAVHCRQHELAERENVKKSMESWSKVINEGRPDDGKD
jgi:hypothetical protein